MLAEWLTKLFALSSHSVIGSLWKMRIDGVGDVQLWSAETRADRIALRGWLSAGVDRVTIALEDAAGLMTDALARPKSISFALALVSMMFPGIDRAITQIADGDRLIVDLRGNTGGGIGGLRLMSYLTPDKIPVGYSLTRRREQKGFKKENLVRVGKIPSRKIALLWLMLRYGIVDQSICLLTDKRTRKPESLDEHELQALFQELELRERVLVLLGVPNGLRVGELLALQWNDLSVKEKTLRTCRAVWHQNIGAREDGGKRADPSAGRGNDR